MNKSKLILIVLILLSSFFLSQAAFADSEVLFECDNLKSALSFIIGKDTITVEDMNELSGKLDLSYNDITSLVGLEHAVNVDDLVLSFNNITDITPIIYLDNLRSLYLDYNWLENLPEIKTNLVKLEHLDISNNEIGKIPTDFISMPELKRLYMGDLALNISPNFSSIANTLDRLDISSSDLQDYSFVKELTNLELLMMNDCNMNELPDLSKMSKLGYLYFINNNIEKLPEYLGSLPLIRLDFSSNIVSFMPDSFANLSTLEQLVFTNNYFTVLPTVVTQMRNLNVLMCGQNIIEDVPVEIANLKNVKRASFAINKLESLDKFMSFNIPYSYQISFDLNYLDLGDATNFEVLKDYRNDGGVQRQNKLEAQVMVANSNSLDIACKLNESELSLLGDNTSYYEIKLFSIQGGELEFLAEKELQNNDDSELLISYSNPTVGSSDYLLCLVLVDETWPTKYIKYTSVLSSVNVLEAITPVPTQAVVETNTPAQPTMTPEIAETKRISTKYLLYILLLGVIIIISAILIHILFYRRK